MPGKNLAVLVDGTPMPDAEAHALWERFSDWMEEHRGDLAGFAAKEGFVSIHPGVDGGRPVLLASRTHSQRPYAAVRASERPDSRGSGGSGGPRRSASAQTSEKPNSARSGGKSRR
jgi:hypothetical protein